MQTDISTYETNELREMRDYVEAMIQEGKEVMTNFTLTDIVQELALRESKFDKIPAWDVEPHTENAFL